MPTMVVEIAWTSKPTTAPASRVWVDVTAYVQSVSIQRGRSDELDRVDAGTCDVKVRNQDGRFDPTYASGAYAPNVDLGKPLRVRATWLGVTYDLFQGYVWNFPPEWPVNAAETVALHAIDELGAMGRASYYRNGGRARELAGSRIVDVIASYWAGGVPDTSQVDAGVAYVAPIGSVDTGGTVTDPLNALQHAQDAALTEGGLFYMLEDGRPRFESRRWRTNTVRDTISMALGDLPTKAFGTAAMSKAGGITLPLGTVPVNSNVGAATSGTIYVAGKEVAYTSKLAGTAFAGCTGGSGSVVVNAPVVWGELGYTGLAPRYDDSYLVNEWNVTGPSGSATAIDVASGSAYYRRTQNRDTIADSALELNGIASFLLGRYKSPALRFPTIELAPAGTPLAWPKVLATHLSDHVVVKRRPPGGRLWRQDCYVEGIRHDIEPGAIWKVSLNMSPADMTDYWRIGSGQLGVTKVGY